jgi:hypothetical protein
MRQQGEDLAHMAPHSPRLCHDRAERDRCRHRPPDVLALTRAAAACLAMQRSDGSQFATAKRYSAFAQLRSRIGKQRGRRVRPPSALVVPPDSVFDQLSCQGGMAV